MNDIKTDENSLEMEETKRYKNEPKQYNKTSKKPSDIAYVFQVRSQ